MKVLHTADLHLGKNLHEVSLLSQQEKMLSDIHTILTKENYAALLIAGDIYDRSIPPTEAVSLFSQFLSSIRTSCPQTAVFIIPGNHDSAQRLAFAHEILQHQNIYIAQDIHSLCTPYTITQNQEKIEIFLLPFLNFDAFSPNTEYYGEFPLNSQAAMAEIASKMLKKAINPQIPSILIGHLFTTEGEESPSERIFIGTAERVPAHFFSYFDYVALGHLHKPQKITNRMYYSGSPLAYSFDEATNQKHVLSIDIDATTEGFPLTVTKIPILPQRPLRRLKGSFYDFFKGVKFDEYRNDFIEIEFTDPEVVINPMALLRQKFPFLMSLKQQALAHSLPEEKETLFSLTQKAVTTETNLLESFIAFEREIQAEPSLIKKETFQGLCKELSDEA